MSATWRFLLIAACLPVVLPAAPAAQPLDPPALEELEGLLRDLGFDPGPVDGVVDADTIEAIRQYQDFALLPGEPEPSEQLLNELRGVAAAFAALNTRAPEPTEVEAAVPEEVPAPPLPEEPEEKVIVPPPPAPPKLAEVPEPAMPEEPTAFPGPVDQTAALPPPDAAPEEEPDPAAVLQARVEAELLPFLHRLQDGSLTRADLAREFNSEGRALLQQSNYDEAILKFSVAIHLDPDFAGAWSNRGTAWQHLKESALAQADFDKAKELGFGGFRKRDAANPLQ
ncbi:MAG: peptidoglycan-binding protein [Bacteroidota bacterium]